MNKLITHLLLTQMGKPITEEALKEYASEGETFMANLCQVFATGLVKGYGFSLGRLGVIQTIDRAARERFDPNTGTKQHVGPLRTTRFRPTRPFWMALNGRN